MRFDGEEQKNRGKWTFEVLKKTTVSPKWFLFHLPTQVEEVQSFFLYSSPPQSRNRTVACSGVMSLCGSAIIS